MDLLTVLSAEIEQENRSKIRIQQADSMTTAKAKLKHGEKTIQEFNIAISRQLSRVHSFQQDITSQISFDIPLLITFPRFKLVKTIIHFLINNSNPLALSLCAHSAMVGFVELKPQVHYQQAL